MIIPYTGGGTICTQCKKQTFVAYIIKEKEGFFCVSCKEKIKEEENTKTKKE